MGPFDWLNNIKRGMEQYFQPGLSQVSNTLSQYFPSKTMNFRLDKSPKAPDIGSVLAASAKANQPAPAAAPSAQDFQSGFSKFNSPAPVATASPAFAQAAEQLPENIDPYLPAIIALMETQGGARQVAENNPFNIAGTQNGNQQFIDYPDLNTAILGGDNGGVNSQGFVGTILNNPAYAGFRSSGNLEDFFNSYTPPGEAYGNPSLEELILRYKNLRGLFPGQ